VAGEQGKKKRMNSKSWWEKTEHNDIKAGGESLVRGDNAKPKKRCGFGLFGGGRLKGRRKKKLGKGTPGENYFFSFSNVLVSVVAGLLVLDPLGMDCCRVGTEGLGGGGLVDGFLQKCDLSRGLEAKEVSGRS